MLLSLNLSEEIESFSSTLRNFNKNNLRDQLNSKLTNNYLAVRIEHRRDYDMAIQQGVFDEERLF